MSEMTTELILALTVVCLPVVGGFLLYLAYTRRYLSRWVSREVERLRREEKAGVPPNPRDYRYAINFDSSGFTVIDLRNSSHEPAAMRWRDISRVTAFKRDLFTVDCICLLFARPDGSEVELDEEMEGWKRFLESLPQHLPGCKPLSEWIRAVAFPAFETNPTLIYDRAVPETGEPKN